MRDTKKEDEKPQQDYEDDLLDEDQLIAKIIRNNGDIKHVPTIDTTYLDSFLRVHLRQMQEAGLI